MGRNFKLIFLVTLAVGLFWGIHTTQANQVANTKYNSKNDKVVNLKIDNIESKITLAGSISTTDIASIRFQTSGKLSWVGVRVGDRVKKGQAIASLDKTELRKNLDKELNSYRSALHNFNDVQDNYKETRERLLVTDEIQRILDRAQYTLNNQVTNYELTELTMKLATIYSPIDGIVTGVDQPIAGINITPATATFTIINPKNIFFKSEIDQEEVTRIRQNQPAIVRLDSFPNNQFESKITYISFIPVSGESSTVYEVRFDLPIDNQELKYRLGMDGDAETITAMSSKTLVAPMEAIYEDDSGKYVWLKRGDQLVRQTISTGVENDSEAEILSGVTINDQIVIRQK